MVEMERLKPLESINWLARNKHGRLCGYDRLPTKSEDRWLPKEGHSFVIMPSTPKHDYIQWKDEHPTYISTLTIKPSKGDKTMLKTFTKSDLQTGMMVTLRDDSIWWVILDVANTQNRVISYLREATHFDPTDDPDFHDLDNYTDNLLWAHGDIPEAQKEIIRELDIVKVSTYLYGYAALQPIKAEDAENQSKVLWERKPTPEPKDLTLTEIEELLGYPIRITNTSLKEKIL